MISNNKWNRRFLNLADNISKWSKDPVLKVGAVIVRPDKSIASMGFNGFPPDMLDSHELYSNKEYKRDHIVHAETNAINFMVDKNPCGFTMFTSFHPCEKCAERIVNAGITRVVTQQFLPCGTDWSAKWTTRITDSNAYLKINNVEVVIV